VAPFQSARARLDFLRQALSSLDPAMARSARGRIRVLSEALDDIQRRFGDGRVTREQALAELERDVLPEIADVERQTGTSAPESSPSSSGATAQTAVSATIPRRGPTTGAETVPPVFDPRQPSSRGTSSTDVIDLYRYTTNPSRPLDPTATEGPPWWTTVRASDAQHAAEITGVPVSQRPLYEQWIRVPLSATLDSSRFTESLRRTSTAQIREYRIRDSIPVEFVEHRDLWELGLWVCRPGP
jgi:hypothetical protein